MAEKPFVIRAHHLGSLAKQGSKQKIEIVEGALDDWAQEYVAAGIAEAKANPRHQNRDTWYGHSYREDVLGPQDEGEADFRVAVTYWVRTLLSLAADYPAMVTLGPDEVCMSCFWGRHCRPPLGPSFKDETTLDVFKLFLTTKRLPCLEVGDDVVQTTVGAVHKFIFK